MKKHWHTICFLLLVSVSALAGESQHVVVADPYIDVRTGPGAGYPITQVIERGTDIEVLKRRTDWFKVRGPREVEGWVSSEQLSQTLQPSGAEVDIPMAGLEEFRKRRWELGVLAGDFGGATSLSVFGGYTLSRHLSLEVEAGQLLGNVSDGWLVDASIVHTFAPNWRVTPFVGLGTGVIHVEPKSTAAQAIDRTDQVAVVGAGLKAYLTERFMLRAEYKGYLVLSSRDENEDVDEWKAGFAVFF